MKIVTMDSWHPISTAPFDRDIELCVIDRIGVHAVVFACRRTVDGWINASTKRPVEIRPTHWRDWNQG